MHKNGVSIFFHRIISLVVIAAFLLNAISAQASLDAGFDLHTTANPSMYFFIPSELGSVKDSFNASNLTGKLVIHIQDAHCNYSCQSQLTGILNYLNEHFGVNIVNLEGGAEGYDLDIFNRINDPNLRCTVADSFVKDGILNGAEYAAIAAKGKLKLWGAEDPGLYMENLLAYRGSIKFRFDADAMLGSIGRYLNVLKTSVYSKELFQLDLNYGAYKAGNIELRPYVLYLMDEALKNGIGIEEFPNISILRKAFDLETTISFKKASDERDALVKTLSKKLSPNAMSVLVRNSLEFKASRISEPEYYKYLLGEAAKLNLDETAYSNMQKYLSYLSVYASADKLLAIDELEALGAVLKEKLAPDPASRELVGLSKDLSVLKNMFNLSLSKSDYRYYKENEPGFAAARFVKFIDNTDHSAFGLRMTGGGSRSFWNGPVRIGGNNGWGDIGRLDGYRKEMERFYDYSLERDEAFLRNMRFSGPGNNIAVIVTGGFHSENIADLLRKSGVSYVSILPNFKCEKECEKKYFKLLSGDIDGISATPPAKAAYIQVPSMLSHVIAEKAWGKDGLGQFKNEVLSRGGLSVARPHKAASRAAVIYPVTALSRQGSTTGKTLLVTAVSFAAVATVGAACWFAWPWVKAVLICGGIGVGGIFIIVIPIAAIMNIKYSNEVQARFRQAYPDPGEYLLAKNAIKELSLVLRDAGVSKYQVFDLIATYMPKELPKEELQHAIKTCLAMSKTANGIDQLKEVLKAGYENIQRRQRLYFAISAASLNANLYPVSFDPKFRIFGKDLDILQQQLNLILRSDLKSRFNAIELTQDEVCKLLTALISKEFEYISSYRYESEKGSKYLVPAVRALVALTDSGIAKEKAIETILAQIVNVHQFTNAHFESFSDLTGILKDNGYDSARIAGTISKFKKDYGDDVMRIEALFMKLFGQKYAFSDVLRLLDTEIPLNYSSQELRLSAVGAIEDIISSEKDLSGKDISAHLAHLRSKLSKEAAKIASRELSPQFVYFGYSPSMYNNEFSDKITDNIISIHGSGSEGFIKDIVSKLTSEDDNVKLSGLRAIEEILARQEGVADSDIPKYLENKTAEMLTRLRRGSFVSQFCKRIDGDMGLSIAVDLADNKLPAIYGARSADVLKDCASIVKKGRYGDYFLNEKVRSDFVEFVTETIPEVYGDNAALAIEIARILRSNHYYGIEELIDLVGRRIPEVYGKEKAFDALRLAVAMHMLNVSKYSFFNEEFFENIPRQTGIDLSVFSTRMYNAGIRFQEWHKDQGFSGHPYGPMKLLALGLKDMGELDKWYDWKRDVNSPAVLCAAGLSIERSRSFEYIFGSIRDDDNYGNIAIILSMGVSENLVDKFVKIHAKKGGKLDFVAKTVARYFPTVEKSTGLTHDVLFERLVCKLWEEFDQKEADIRLNMAMDIGYDKKSMIEELVSLGTFKNDREAWDYLLFYLSFRIDDVKKIGGFLKAIDEISEKRLFDKLASSTGLPADTFKELFLKKFPVSKHAAPASLACNIAEELNEIAESGVVDKIAKFGVPKKDINRLVFVGLPLLLSTGEIRTAVEVIHLLVSAGKPFTVARQFIFKMLKISNIEHDMNSNVNRELLEYVIFALRNGVSYEDLTKIFITLREPSRESDLLRALKIANALNSPSRSEELLKIPPHIVLQYFGVSFFENTLNSKGSKADVLLEIANSKEALRLVDLYNDKDKAYDLLFSKLAEGKDQLRTAAFLVVGIGEICDLVEREKSAGRLDPDRHSHLLDAVAVSGASKEVIDGVSFALDIIPADTLDRLMTTWPGAGTNITELLTTRIRKLKYLTAFGSRLDEDSRLALYDNVLSDAVSDKGDGTMDGHAFTSFCRRLSVLELAGANGFEGVISARFSDSSGFNNNYEKLALEARKTVHDKLLAYGLAIPDITAILDKIDSTANPDDRVRALVFISAIIDIGIDANIGLKLSAELSKSPEKYDLVLSFMKDPALRGKFDIKEFIGGILPGRIPERVDMLKLSLDSIRLGLDRVPGQKLIRFLDSPDGERALDKMLLNDDHESVFTEIGAFMDGLDDTQKRAFLNKILPEVGRDKGVDSNWLNSHSRLDKTISLLNGLGKVIGSELNWRDIILSSDIEDPGFKTLAKELIGDGACFNNWKNFERLGLLANMIANRDLLKAIQDRRNGTSEGESLYKYYQFLILHSSMKDFDALKKMILDPAAFLGIDDKHTDSSVNAEKKPSRFLDLHYIDISGRELVDGLILGKLDALQAMRSHSIKVSMIDLDDKLKSLRGLAAIEYLLASGYASSQDIRTALIQRYIKEEERLAGEGDKARGTLNWVRKTLGSLKDDKQPLKNILPKFEKAAFAVNDLVDAGLELPSYTVSIIPKSDPQAIMTGSEAPSCMAFGSGKNNVYMFNPNTSFLIVSKKVMGEDGNPRQRILATSVLTVDRKIPVNISVLIKQIVEGNTDMSKLLGPDFIDKMSSEAFIGADNVEAAPSEMTRTRGGLSFDDIVRLSYKKFFEDYFRLHPQSRRGRGFSTEKIFIGPAYSDNLGGLGKEPNNYLMQAPVGYSDKFGSEVLVLDLKKQDRAPVPLIDGVLPLSYEDSLEAAFIENSAFRGSELQGNISGMLMELSGADYNEALKGWRRKNISSGYFVKGKLAAYAIAYAGVDKATGTEGVYITDFASGDTSKGIPAYRVLDRVFKEAAGIVRKFKEEDGKTINIVLQATSGPTGSQRLFFPIAGDPEALAAKKVERLKKYGLSIISSKDLGDGRVEVVMSIDPDKCPAAAIEEPVAIDGPAIALSLSDGKWAQHTLTSEQHEIINMAWADLWGSGYDVPESDEIYRDVKNALDGLVRDDLPVHIHSPPAAVVQDKIYEVAGSLDMISALPPKGSLRLVTHPGTYRDQNNRSRSCNLLIPKEEFARIKELRKKDRAAYDEWLDHETSHIASRADKAKGREKSEAVITASHGISGFLRAINSIEEALKLEPVSPAPAEMKRAEPETAKALNDLEPLKAALLSEGVGESIISKLDSAKLNSILSAVLDDKMSKTQKAKALSLATAGAVAENAANRIMKALSLKRDDIAAAEVISEMKDSDVEVVAALSNLVPHSNPTSADELRIAITLRNAPNSEFQLITLVHRSLGRTDGYVSATLMRGLGLAYIDQLVVDPKARNKGIGGKLVDKIISVSRDEGCDKFLTAASQASRGIFVKAGFEDAENLKRYAVSRIYNHKEDVFMSMDSTVEDWLTIIFARNHIFTEVNNLLAVAKKYDITKLSEYARNCFIHKWFVAERLLLRNDAMDETLAGVIDVNRLERIPQEFRNFYLSSLNIVFSAFPQFSGHIKLFKKDSTGEPTELPEGVRWIDVLASELARYAIDPDAYEPKTISGEPVKDATLAAEIKDILAGELVRLDEFAEHRGLIYESGVDDAGDAQAVIGPVRLADVDGVLELSRIINTQAPLTLDSLKRIATMPGRGFLNMKTRVYVHRNNGRVDGYVYFEIIPQKKFGFILQIVVDDKLRGSGIGSELLKKAMADMRALGIEKFGCSAEPAAVNFFSKNGFTELDGWRDIPMVLFRHGVKNTVMVHGAGKSDMLYEYLISDMLPQQLSHLKTAITRAATGDPSAMREVFANSAMHWLVLSLTMPNNDILDKAQARRQSSGLDAAIARLLAIADFLTLSTVELSSGAWKKNGVIMPGSFHPLLYWIDQFVEYYFDKDGWARKALSPDGHMDPGLLNKQKEFLESMIAATNEKLREARITPVLPASDNRTTDRPEKPKPRSASSIRSATEKDFDAVERLAGMIKDYGEGDQDQFNLQVKSPKLPLGSRTLILVHETGGKIDGFVRGNIYADEKLGYLMQVSVDPGSRNRGIGSELALNFIDNARAAGCDKFMVMAGPESKSIFEKAGFKPIERARNYGIVVGFFSPDHTAMGIGAGIQDLLFIVTGENFLSARLGNLHEARFNEPNTFVRQALNDELINWLFETGYKPDDKTADYIIKSFLGPNPDRRVLLKLAVIEAGLRAAGANTWSSIGWSKSENGRSRDMAPGHNPWREFARRFSSYLMDPDAYASSLAAANSGMRKSSESELRIFSGIKKRIDEEAHELALEEGEDFDPAATVIKAPSLAAPVKDDSHPEEAIRPAEPRDYDKVVYLSNLITKKDMAREDYEYLISGRSSPINGAPVVMVHETGGIVDGFVKAHLYKDRGLAYITNVATDPGARGKGYAKALLGKLMDFARSRGIERFIVMAGPESLAIFENMGFKEISGVKNTSAFISYFPSKYLPIGIGATAEDALYVVIGETYLGDHFQKFFNKFHEGGLKELLSMTVGHTLTDWLINNKYYPDNNSLEGYMRTLGDIRDRALKIHIGVILGGMDAAALAKHDEVGWNRFIDSKMQAMPGGFNPWHEFTIRFSGFLSDPQKYASDAAVLKGEELEIFRKELKIFKKMSADLDAEAQKQMKIDKRDAGEQKYQAAYGGMIERVRAEDAPEVCELSAHIKSADKLQESVVAKFANRALDQFGGNNLFFVYRENGKVLGYIFGVAYTDRKLVYIGQMAVDPASRGKGIGTALLNKYMEEAKKLGVERYYAAASRDSAGIFKKAGFSELSGARSNIVLDYHTNDDDEMLAKGATISDVIYLIILQQHILTTVPYLDSEIIDAGPAGVAEIAKSNWMYQWLYANGWYPTERSIRDVSNELNLRGHAPGDAYMYSYCVAVLLSTDDYKCDSVRWRTRDEKPMDASFSPWAALANDFAEYVVNRNAFISRVKQLAGTENKRLLNKLMILDSLFKEYETATARKKELLKQSPISQNPQEPANAAKAAIGDINRGTTDIIIMPGSDIYRSGQADIVKSTAAGLKSSYGLDTLSNCYIYSIDAWLEDLTRHALPKSVAALRERIASGDKAARMLVYVPADGVNSVKEITNKQYPDVAARISVIGEDRIPDNGLVDNVMHIVLGKSLLNYERYVKGDYDPKGFSDMARSRLADLIKSLVSDPQAIDLKKDPDIINKLLDGAITLQFSQTDFKEIKDWKLAQEAVLRSL